MMNNYGEYLCIFKLFEEHIFYAIIFAP